MSINRLWSVIMAIALSLLTSIAFSQVPSGFGNNFELNQLTVNNGLSQNSVTSIVQDKSGFIWVGTYDGLNKFDGLQVTNYRHQNNNPFSIADNRILSLCALNNNDIFIGTEGGGLALFSQQSEKFIRIQFQNASHHISSSIVSICKNNKGAVWVANRKRITFIEKLEQPESKAQKSISIEAPSGSNIQRVFCDESNNLWIGTDNGLYLVPHTKSNGIPVKAAEGHIFSVFEDTEHNIWYAGYGVLGALKMQDANVIALPALYETLRKSIFSQRANMLVSSITQDKNKNIWLTTDQMGAFKCSLSNRGEFYIREHYYSDSKYCNLPEDNINCGFIDGTNTLWLGTFQNGISYTSLNRKNIYSFLPLIGSKQGKYITTIYAAPNNLWIGTMDRGLWKYNTINQQYLPDTKVGSRSILSFYAAANGTLYAGGNDGLYEQKPNTQWQKLLDKITIRSICADNFNRLWIATWSGIIIYNPLTKSVERLNEENGLSSNMGYVLRHDKKENAVWYGTIGGGLNKIAYADNAIKSVKKYSYQENGKGMSSNHIWCLYQDEKNNVWAGTDAGLDIITDKEIAHVEHPELKNRKITSIKQDELGYLWLGTGNGLARYSTTKKTLKLYTHSDGLLSNTLTEASAITPNGAILVGTINGINSFYPDKIRQDNYPASIAVTSLFIYGKPISPEEKIDGKTILSSSINNLNEINLKHNQNNLSFSVAALHFASPSANQIRYKLEGYDKNWNYGKPGSLAINYSHLPAGSFQLIIEAANNDGLWSKESKQLNINISPSPWLSVWAKSIYLIAILGIAWLIYRNYRSRKNMQQQVFLEKYEKEKIVELNELKLDFFTKITHDLRTPLSLIVGPATDLSENLPEKNTYVAERVNIIQRNAVKLYGLINQVLDFRTVSGSNNKLQLKKEGLKEIIAEVKNSFSLLAETRNMLFTLTLQKHDAETWVDREKIEKVLYNLISNAFNYTEDGGAIAIDVVFSEKDNQTWSHIKITDNGKGIDQNDLPHIFEMYYHGGGQTNIGNGIGLAIAKKLTELQNGHITVESTLGKGSTFTFSIPVDEIKEINAVNHHFDMIETAIIAKPSHEEAQKKDCILIVEDDPDLLDYLSGTLNDYLVVRAERAESALELAKKHQPQLIISDLMLPGMNGQAFLKLIKNEARTSHIPVIIHTVKYDRDTIKALMDSGADDFIPKPTNYNDLKKKVKNIISTRKKLIETLHKNYITEPHFEDLPSANESFLLKIFKCVEKNISNPDFSVEKLSSEMAMSRMNLHRKLDTIIGKTASELIREIRMKKAGQLLASGSRISEVMYEVGISSNHYFNKYFKEMYGITAKEYAVQHQKKQG